MNGYHPYFSVLLFTICYYVKPVRLTNLQNDDLLTSAGDKDVLQCVYAAADYFQTHLHTDQLTPTA
jgi:hypothetical protein